ncbi:hypothetical protein FGADI_7798 [Fusarium gaditjirri]|uniref:Uncharacterized protein n=1 Tax=Fusarium gaditjirri TaxID=282569 RepID=A0A8H4T4B0_9HYPO|nr:hypothetical protein FGADI_7798 [Fusarium gaditjirri]
MYLEAQLLLKYGLAELTACLDDHSPETLLVFIMLLNFFQDRMPTERDKFLRYCIDETQPSKRAQPLMDILRHIDAAERKSAEPQKHKSTGPEEREEANAEFCANLLHDVATMFINKLKQKLRYDELGYAVIQHMHQTGELEDFKRLTWPDPYLAQENDEAFFSSRANIEHYIVLAVERFGYRELLQIKDVLNRQIMLAENSEIREMIDKHLTSLRRPIQRIGYRDNFNNMKKFKEHWSRTTAGWETSLVVKGPNHIIAMLHGMRRFKDFEDDYQVSLIKKNLYNVFLGIAEDLGEQESYMMVQDGILHSAWREDQENSLWVTI